MPKEISLENVLNSLRDGVKFNDRELDKFSENFATNPAYAFEWGTGAVEAAVKKTVALRLIGDIEAMQGDGTLRPAEVLKTLAKRADDEVRRRALSTSRSTSPLANLCKDAELLAWAEIAQTLNHYLKAE